MDHRPVLRVWNRAAEYLMGDRCNVAFSEQHETKQVSNRIALGPLEISVGNFPRRLFQVDQHSGNGIGNHRASRMQNRVFADPVAHHAQGVFELGGISSLDFEKVKAFLGAEIVKASGLPGPFDRAPLRSRFASAARLDGSPDLHPSPTAPSLAHPVQHRESAVLSNALHARSKVTTQRNIYRVPAPGIVEIAPLVARLNHRLDSRSPT